VANAFNLVSKGVIFQEHHTIGGDIMQLIPFFPTFYAFESPLFYNHCNCEGDVTIIPFAMGTYQGDPLGGALFASTHFKALHFITSQFPFCLFPSIANDTHIIVPLSIISSAYEHFQIKFHAICSSIQPHKCVAWSPCSLLFDFNTPS
jgi:hypothetical protein